MNFGFLAELFFPRVCAGCRAGIREGALCAPCRRGIAIARALDTAAAGVASASGHAAAGRSFRYRVGAAASYDHRAVRALVHALKFQGMRACGPALAELLIEYAAGIPIDLALFTIMPIPLSRQRLRGRGFNQSELIARHFARHFGLALDTTTLARIRHTKPQSEMESAAERMENIRGCFAVHRAKTVRGARIILIDDVTTSGATFLEATKTLRAAGATEVLALAAARPRG